MIKRYIYCVVTVLIGASLARSLAAEPSKEAEMRVVKEVEWQRLITPDRGAPADETFRLLSDGTAWHIYRLKDQRGSRLVRDKAEFSKADFARLTSLLRSASFFDFQANYPVDFPSNAFKTTVLLNDDSQKTVIRQEQVSASSDDQIPVTLWGIEMAIRGVTAGLDWKNDPAADKSGIRGVATIAVSGNATPNVKPQVLPAARIQIRTADGVYALYSVEADQDGKFSVNVPPGTYRVVGLGPVTERETSRSEVRTVVVSPDKWVQVSVQFPNVAH